MTRIFTFLTLFLASITASANTIVKASSDFVRQTVNVKFSDITELVTNTCIDIEYSQSNTQKVEVYAPSNIIRFIKIEHSGTTLTAKFNQSLTIKGNCTIKLIVSGPNVKTFITNSSGDIHLMTRLNAGNEVKCITNSSGDIKGSVILAPNIKFTTNSSGDINFTSVDCTTFNGNTNSSGDIKCQSITAVNVNLYANSSGDVYGGKIICDILNTTSNSSGDVSAQSANCSSLSAVCSSSGDLRISGITANSVRATSGSSGNIYLNGYCNEATLSASSSSDILAGDLKAKTVVATTNSSSASITCYAADRLQKYQARNSTIRNLAKGHYVDIMTEE